MPRASAAMWRMLCARGKDLRVVASRHRAPTTPAGRAHWVATYTYSATGRRSRTGSTRRSRSATAASCGTTIASTSTLGAAGARHEGRAARLAAADAGRDPRAGGAGAAAWRAKNGWPRARPALERGSAARTSLDAAADHGAFHPRAAVRARPPPRVGVLLVNLGTPDAPTPTAVRRYLAEFLSDPRVVEIPRVAVAADPAWRRSCACGRRNRRRNTR